MKTDWNQFTASPLERLSDALETAGDKWRICLQDTAEKENEYLRCFHIAFTQASAENIPVTIRQKHAETALAVVNAKCELNFAKAREKAAASKVEELKSRIIASMSDQKYKGQADGGF